MSVHKKILSICIPTYNRANYLMQSLTQIHKELTNELIFKVEILVSDNCSTDNTSEIIGFFIDQGLNINYIKNEINIGWGRNFLQCFEMANSKYVLLLGDDDVLCDNSIETLVEFLEKKEIGVLTFKCYGYDNDWKSSYPFSFGKAKYFNDSIKYLKKIGPDITMISSCVVNKDFIKMDKLNISPNDNFSHVHLNILSSLIAESNLYIPKYLVAVKRNNSSDYSWSKLFIEEIWNIFEMYQTYGINDKVLKELKTEWLFSYYPFYWLSQRITKDNDYINLFKYSEIYFKGIPLYYIWARPILAFPRYFAIIWGFITTVIGRIINGELSKGFLFIVNKFFR